MPTLGEILKQVAEHGCSEPVSGPSQELLDEARSWGLTYYGADRRFHKFVPGRRTYEVEIQRLYVKKITLEADSYAEARAAASIYDTDDGFIKVSTSVSAKEVNKQ